MSQIDVRTFEHDKRVMLCRVHREKSGQIKSWISERRLKQEFAHLSQSLAREFIPDAIYTNRRGERVAFELELAPKTPSRYERKITQFMGVMRNPEGLFQRTLFVSCSDFVKRTLQDLTRSYAEYFRVTPFEEMITAFNPVLTRGGKSI